jgi:Flp pilus assembly protein TadD
MRVVLRRRPVPTAVSQAKAALDEAELAQKAKILDVALIQFGRGISLMADKRFEDAVEPLKLAVYLFPAEPKFRNVLGMCLVEIGQLKKAEQELKEAYNLSFGIEKGNGPLTRIIETNLKEVEDRLSRHLEQ